MVCARHDVCSLAWLPYEETNARECGGKAELRVSLSSPSPVFPFPHPASHYTVHDSTTTTTTTQRRLRRAPPIGRCGVMVHDVIIAKLRMRTAGALGGHVVSDRDLSANRPIKREREREKKMAIARARTHSVPTLRNERSTLHSRKCC